MRISRILSKLSINYLYLYIVLISSTYYVCYQYVKYKQKIHRPVCTIKPNLHLNDQKARPSYKFDPRLSPNRHTGCTSGPVYTKWEVCPHCFRSTVYNISTHLQRMPRNSSLFPRAPPAFFQPRKEVQQRLITKTLLTPTTVCQDTCPYLIAIMPSVIDDYDVRNTIRMTWASVVKTRLWPHSTVNGDMQVIFVLAIYTTESLYNRKKQVNKNREFAYHTEITRVQQEAIRYGDILYLDMHESYYNLSLKVMSAYKWVRDHCPRVKFVLKVDVDTFVNVPLLLDLLIFNEERLEYSVLGYGYTMNGVERTGKWGVSQAVWSPGIYPLYASGFAYVCSAEALTAMLSVCEYVPMIIPLGAETDIPEDYPREQYVMGILRLIIDYDIYLLQSVFTYEEDNSWVPCDILVDKKALGKVADNDDMFKLWRLLLLSYGKCWRFEDE